MVQQASYFWQRIFLGLILLTAFIVYAPIINFHFVNLDDPSLVYENPFVTSFSLSRVAHSFATYDPELYIPLTFVSYQIETVLLGLQPWHFHVINLVLHLGCVTLLFGIIRRLLDARVALITAALFALHPINTEAVAWISARKDVLSAFFALASFYVFLEFRQTDAPKWYIATIGLFAAALLSKASSITLPAIFLLIDLYEKRRVNKKMIMEYIPFIALIILFGVIALIGKSANISHAALSPFGWILLSVKAIVVTTTHILWPLHLSPFYPVSGAVSITQSQLFIPILLVVITCISVAMLRVRSLIIAVGIFLLGLVPSFFTFAKDDHLYLTTDRYAYLPSIIIFLLVAIGLSHLLAKKKYRTGILILILALLIACSVASAQQSQIWRDSVTFNQYILARVPNEYHAINNLGVALEAKGKTTEALGLFKQAIEVNPHFERAYLNAGSLLGNQKKYTDAIYFFSQGINQNKQSVSLRENLGLAQEKAGLVDDAITTYESLLVLRPRNILALQELAALYGKKKDFIKALDLYKRLMDIDPAFKARVMEQIQANSVKQ